MPQKGQRSGLSSSEFKQQMYSSLQSSGIINQVKGYLRQNLIKELQNKRGEGGQSDALFHTITKRGESAWQQKALDNLVLRHLQQNRYLYTVSLFMQESGVREYDKSLTDELLRSLGCHDLSVVDNDTSGSFMSATSTPAGKKEDASTLWSILDHLSSLKNFPQPTEFHEEEAQHLRLEERQEKKMSLADKLKAIDDEITERTLARRRDVSEARLAMHDLTEVQRNAQEQATKVARDDLEQWKKVELANMKLEQMQRTRQEITSKCQELEDDFSRKRDALLTRERAAIDRLNTQKELLEKEHHQQRQLLLQEIDQLRLRERALHEREVLMQNMEMMKLKEMGHQQPADNVHYDTEKTRRESAVSSYAESLRRSLNGKEGRHFDEILKEIESQSRESSQIRQELATVKEELSQTKVDLQLSRPSASTGHTPLRKENDTLRTRLDDISRNMSEMQQQYRAEKEASLNEEMNKWKEEVQLLSEARRNQEEKHRMLEDMTLKLQASLHAKTMPQRIIHPDVGLETNRKMQSMIDPTSRTTDYLEPYRKYDMPRSGRVKWADIPTNQHISPREHLPQQQQSPRNMTQSMRESVVGNSEVNDSGNTTTSSHDVSSIANVRLDIQQKFKQLERESEELEQTYQRYLRENYKDGDGDHQTIQPYNHAYSSKPVDYLSSFYKPDITKHDTATFKTDGEREDLFKKPEVPKEKMPEMKLPPSVTRSRIQDALDEQKVKRRVDQSEISSSSTSLEEGVRGGYEPRMDDQMKEEELKPNEQEESSSVVEDSLEMKKDEITSHSLSSVESTTSIKDEESFQMKTIPNLATLEPIQTTTPRPVALPRANQPAVSMSNDSLLDLLNSPKEQPPQATARSGRLTPESARERLAELRPSKESLEVVEDEDKDATNIDAILDRIDRKEPVSAVSSKKDESALLSSETSSKDDYSEEFLSSESSSLTPRDGKQKEDRKEEQKIEEGKLSQEDSIEEDIIESVLSEPAADDSSESEYKLHAISVDKEQPSTVQDDSNHSVQSPKNANVFEDSLTSHSLEAPQQHSDQGQNSDDDFSW